MKKRFITAKMTSLPSTVQIKNFICSNLKRNIRMYISSNLNILREIVLSNPEKNLVYFFALLEFQKIVFFL